MIQQCAAGLIKVKLQDDSLAFAAPPTIRTGPLEADYLTAATAALQITPDRVIAHQWIDNGSGWAAVRLATAAEVLALDPDFSHLPNAVLGVVGAHPIGSDTQFEVRGFAPGLGISEDPVTGSLNAGPAQWLIRTQQAPSTYRVSQGSRVGREGTIIVTAALDGKIWVGGRATICITGSVTI